MMNAVFDFGRSMFFLSSLTMMSFSMKAAKKVYESLLTDGTHNASLANIQVSDFANLTHVFFGWKDVIGVTK